MKAYLIVDVGTGNLRLAICDRDENLLALERRDIVYHNDPAYPDAQYFEPDKLWKDILELGRRVVERAEENHPDLEITAITATSQREGIVLIGQNGEDLIGFPNHDHRGREWEKTIPDPEIVYQKTGRKVSSLFSALKVRGYLEKYPEKKSEISKIASISDWVTYKMSGVLVYEHSQASETNLYDVQNKEWDTSLCTLFSLFPHLLPPLAYAGTKLGPLRPGVREPLKIAGPAEVLTGGADTQMAINSTAPALNDLVIVAGTTTPVVKVKDEYILDAAQRSWTNSHLHEKQYILEVNAGVTGLNLQRVKNLFYPRESYTVLEEELYSLASDRRVTASLGSLICSEPRALVTGGFVFKTPVNHELNRADFVLSVLWDMAFSIKENLEVLSELDPVESDFIWICGGGAQGDFFNQMLADVLGYDLRIRPGFRQASVNGAVKLCNQSMGYGGQAVSQDYEEVKKSQRKDLDKIYAKWKQVREHFKTLQGDG